MSEDKQAPQPRGDDCGDITESVELPDPSADERVTDNNERSRPSRGRRCAPVQDSSSDDMAASSAQKRIRCEVATRDIHVQVEAFGSGVLLHDGLAVSLEATIAELQQLVLSSARLPPRTRTVRLFVGHGGTELDDSDAKLASIPSLVAAEADGTPLVVFPTMCKLRMDETVASRVVIAMYVCVLTHDTALTHGPLCDVRGRARSRRGGSERLVLRRIGSRARGRRRPSP